MTAEEDLPTSARVSAASNAAIARAEGVLRYLDEGLTRKLPVPGNVYALRIYNETEDGVHYSLQPADDISNQGDACADDLCRALVLACDLWTESGSARARRMAERWRTFLNHVEIKGRPGVYAPFVFADGRLNIGGFNSRPPSKWVQGNVARGWAHLWRAFGDLEARRRFWEVRRKSTPDLKAVANRVEGDLTAYEAARAEQDEAGMGVLRQRITHDVERIVANRYPEGHFADFRLGAEPPRLRGTVQLWGYHQLMSVARATRLLHRPDWLEPCVDTVRRLIDPVLEACFPTIPYSWPVDERCHPRAWPDSTGRWAGTAYHVSSLVAGLAELYLTTGDSGYAERASRIAEWLVGENPAGDSMYHPVLGGCYDGILEGRINRNLGAESSIEAGRAELFRFRSASGSVPEQANLGRLRVVGA